MESFIDEKFIGSPSDPVFASTFAPGRGKTGPPACELDTGVGGGADEPVREVTAVGYGAGAVDIVGVTAAAPFAAEG